MGGQHNTVERAENEPNTAESLHESAARLLYDGDCGFCHWVVRFVIERDPIGAFRYAPIGGPTFHRVVADRMQEPYPDTVMLLLPDGRLLLRSDAAIEILRRLASPWPSWARFLALFPRPLRDLGYRMVAAIRRRLTRRPASSCPLLPPAQLALFDP